MCGILGSVNREFGQDVLELLAHRGPDDMGLAWVRAGENLIGLGHTRLAIVDLSPAGRQPMSTVDNGCSVVFNGEIYNHLELRSQTERADFRGHSDTETILYWLAERGIKAVDRLNGIFALAFVDFRVGKLYLARDPFGVKPLYYAAEGQSLVFSSEIKPLLRVVDDRLAPENLAELLRLRYSPSPDMLFRSIKKVRPGHIVEVDFSQPKISHREYPYIATVPGNASISFGEAVEQYGSLFEQAVNRQLMSDVEVGILLSGGIDSALVASYAQKQSGYRLKGFTVGFKEDTETDEIGAAKETAAIIGMDHYSVRIGFEDFLTTIKVCTSIVEEPLATTSVVPMYYLAELASTKVKVVLSGQGADEPLGGYRRYQGELYKHYLPANLLKLSMPIVKALGLKSDGLLRGLDALSEDDDVSRFLKTYQVFGEDEIESLIGHRDTKSRDRIGYYFDLLGCARQPTSVERMMSLDLRMNLADDLLLYTDKITMHHSLECRVPMLDHELIRFVEALPYGYRLKHGATKIVHKAFAGNSLPGFVVQRKKMGFLSPTNEWFLRQQALEDILLNTTSRFSSFFDVRAVKRTLDEHVNGYNRERQIFLLLSLYYWMEEYA